MHRGYVNSKGSTINIAREANRKLEKNIFAGIELNSCLKAQLSVNG